MRSELAAFLESGVSVVVATCDAELRPGCACAAGLRVHDGARRMTILLPSGPAAASVEHLRAHATIAVTASRPIDLRTVQVKGRVVRVAAASDEERPLALAYREALATALERVGHDRSLTRRLAVWPCVSVELEIDAVFEQTPGPRAGAPLERG